MHLLPMSMMNETSKPKSADPVSVFIGSTLATPAGSAPFSELEMGGSSVSEKGKQIMLHYGEGAAEAKDGSAPVAGATPTDWFQLAVELCHEGYITPKRRDNAIKAVREALQ